MSMVIPIYFSDRAEVVLLRIARERGCTVESLAEAAVEDAAIREETEDDRREIKPWKPPHG